MRHSMLQAPETLLSKNRFIDSYTIEMNEDVIINNENATIQRVEFKRTTTSQYKLTEKTG